MNTVGYNKKIYNNDNTEGREAVMSKFLFALQWFLIAAISSLDLYLAIKLQSVLYEYEKNPIGLMLMDLDEGGVALFMGLKRLGTCSVLGILFVLWTYNKKRALAVIAGVSAFQIGLLYYLFS